MAISIHIKRSESDRIILDIIKFLEDYDPAYMAQVRKEMKQIRQISTSGYRTSHGDVHVAVKVPTMLFMACQYVMPDWGYDSDDLAQLTRLCGDYDGHVPHKRNSLLLPRTFKTKKGSKKPDEPIAAPQD